MKKPSPTLTPQELEIMKVLWSRGPSTVRDVYEVLLERRKLAYTTVMTMLNVLERKGHLQRRAEGRSFVYRTSRPQRLVVAGLVRDFVKRVFGGSAQPLLVQLVDEHDLTPEELDAVAKRIEQARQKEKR